MRRNDTNTSLGDRLRGLFAGPQRSRGSMPGRRLRLEPLEERQLLAVFWAGVDDGSADEEHRDEGVFALGVSGRGPEVDYTGRFTLTSSFDATGDEIFDWGDVDCEVEVFIRFPDSSEFVEVQVDPFYDIPFPHELPATAAVKVVPHNDALDEGDHSITLTLVNLAGNVCCGEVLSWPNPTPPAAVTIADDDQWTISVTNDPENDEAVERIEDSLDFSVIRSGGSDDRYPIEIDATLSGGADWGDDYDVWTLEDTDGDGTLESVFVPPPTGSSDLTFAIPAGETTGTLTIVPKNDALKEPDETVTLTITSAESHDITVGDGCEDTGDWGPGGPFDIVGSDTASVTILDDDWWDATVVESDSEALEPCTWIPVPDRRGSFAVSRVPVNPARADTTFSAKVELEFSGTARALGDFYGDDPRDYEVVDAPGNVIGAVEDTGGSARAIATIPAGATSATVYVQPHGDAVFEEIETVVASVAEAYCGLSDGSDPDYTYGVGSPSTSGDVNIIQAPEFVSEVDGPFTGPRPVNADSYHRIISAVAKSGTDTYGDLPIAAVAPNGRTFNYSIHSGNDEGLFQIDATTGDITAATDFVNPQQSTYYLQIKAFDTAEARLYDLATVSIVLLDLNTLTLTDGNDAANAVTDPTGTEKLYVLQQEDGTAPIDISLTWTPDAASYAGYMKWELVGADVANWSPTSGGFSGGNATTTWTEPGSGSPNREFTTTAWADMNGDGLVNADEPTRQLELVVGKATFTMYADQPVPGTRDIIDLDVLGVGAGSVGHTFWRVDVTPAVLPRISTVLHPFANNTWGYYPVGDVGPGTPSATRNVSTLLRQQRVGISVVGLASRAVLFGCGGQPPRPWDFLRHALGCPRVVVG